MSTSLCKRNLLPVFSIEGKQEKTDERRGSGVYSKLKQAMESARKKRLFFGASITMTTENLHEITDDAFLDNLQNNG